MSEAAAARGPVVSIDPAAGPEDMAEIRSLFLEYAAFLDFSLCFQDFDQELADLPGDYAPPAGRLWLARVDGRDGAHLSSWPGENGVGKHEDLLTHPALGNRGVALAVIHHGVWDARERGAGPVVIGARPEDTPKRLYARLGFRPFCVCRSWLLGRVPGT